MIYFLRASHANEFELQNYAPIAKELDIQVVTSHHPLTPISLSHTALWSPTDLPNFPLRRQLLNRLIGGEQWLYNLEKLITHKNSNYSNNRSIKQRVIVHAAETYSPYTHQAVELRERGVIDKLVCTCWETIPHANEKFARLRHWKQESYQYVDIFHTPTERAKQALVAEGVDPKKIVVIPYGVDLTRFKSLPIRDRKPDHKRPIILTVARLEQEKGMQDLESVAHLLPQFNFRVIGRGTYNPRGSNIAISTVPYSKIHRVYQSADLFFLPSRTTSTWEEQYGMALVEAMACGLPIVTTTCGAIPEVVGNAGIIHTESDVSGMARSITDLLSNSAKYEQLSKLALSRAKAHYDAVRVSRHLATLYS